MTASETLSNDHRKPSSFDLGADGRFEARLARPKTADRRWLKLGIAAALGFVAGATLFATEARGRDPARQRPVRRG